MDTSAKKIHPMWNLLSAGHRRWTLRLYRVPRNEAKAPEKRKLLQRGTGATTTKKKPKPTTPHKHAHTQLDVLFVSSENAIAMQTKERDKDEMGNNRGEKRRTEMKGDFSVVVCPSLIHAKYSRSSVKAPLSHIPKVPDLL